MPPSPIRSTSPHASASSESTSRTREPNRLEEKAHLVVAAFRNKKHVAQRIKDAQPGELATVFVASAPLGPGMGDFVVGVRDNAPATELRFSGLSKSGAWPGETASTREGPTNSFASWARCIEGRLDRELQGERISALSLQQQARSSRSATGPRGSFR